MTPKEKAEELFEKYYRLFNNFPNYQYVLENLNTIQDEKLYTTKQCALIAIDEIIKQGIENAVDDFYSDQGYYFDNLIYEILGYNEYWNKVKTEIEKI